MFRLKKGLLAAFAIALGAMLTLAGCGQATGGAKDNNSGSANSASPSSSPSELKPVKLVWYYLGDNKGDYEQVYAAANKIIQAKINATVDFQPMSNGDFKTKMPLKVAAGEKFDLTYTADYIFSYHDNITKGAFIPLDDLINKYALQTKRQIPNDIWEATKMNGKIYAVPNYQISSRQASLIFNKALVDKYNLKDKIFAVKKMSDLSPIFDVIKKNEPGIYPSLIAPNSRKYEVRTKIDYIEQFDAKVPVGVGYDLKVVDLTQGKYKQEALNGYKLAREWQQKGFYHPDAALSKDLNPEKKAGKFFMIEDNFKPGVEADSKAKWGYDVYAVPMAMPVLSTGSIDAALTAISRTSENPERAMMLINLMQTDEQLLNLLTFGIEGVDYKKTGGKSIEVIAKTPYAGKAWAIGNQFLAYTLPGQAADVWEQTKKLNSSATPAPTIGFSFDNNPVKTELANMNAVSDKYVNIFNFGMVDNYAEMYDKYIAEMKSAGLDKYKVELQKQVDAWKATRK
jgi:putative aldouronate transport system substrate-binding protein